MNKTAPKKATLTVEEFAKTVGISRGLAYLAVKRGEVPAIRLGKRILLPANAIERWLQEAGFGHTEEIA